MPFVSTRLVGGLRFVKVGRLCVSWCVSAKARPFDDGGIDAEVMACGYTVAALAHAALALDACRVFLATGDSSAAQFAAFFLVGFLLSSFGALYLCRRLVADGVAVQS